MDTARIDICYRPLRIAMAVHSDDISSFRRAVRLNHAFWGGRFNPIVFADRVDEARAIIEVFRADFIVAIGDSEQVTAFIKLFPHLINPLFSNELFADLGGTGRSHILDVHNALVHWRDKPEWRAIKEKGFRRIVWEQDDPLANALLVQYGDYPDPTEVGRDYASELAAATMAVDERIDPSVPTRAEILQYPGLGFLSRLGLTRHHSVQPSWHTPGFYIGDNTDINDLAAFWNLRAADIGLHFVDLAHIARYRHLIPALKSDFSARLPEGGPMRGLTFWARSDEIFPQIAEHFGDEPRTHSRVTETIWNGLNVMPPMMMLGDASSLAVVGERDNRPSISFTLNNKPFASDVWFYTQHLVASVFCYSGSSTENATFQPPYVPELNEYFARRMCFDFDKLRIEPDRIGIIIDAADHDITLNAASTYELVEKAFELAGLKSKLSSSGLIARQLIARLGGVDGARVFKIPGVRKLLKTFGPNKSFTQSVALQIIGGTPRFEDHETLYIEPRERGGNLTKDMVFGYLVEKGLFRTGMELTCPACNLPSWYPLDALHQNNVCELCGSAHDSTRSMIGRQLQYRRTGVLGIERNSQGAVPVVLLLQQLFINLRGIRGGLIELPSHDLEPAPGFDLPVCEVDFVVMRPQTYPNKTEFIIGECKDEGDRINERDIENLSKIADAMPSHRFDTFILLARLSPFSADEIALAKSLNGPFRRRAIMLSARELEPYHMFERTKKEFGVDIRAGSAEDLAAVTSRIYFE